VETPHTKLLQLFDLFPRLAAGSLLLHHFSRLLLLLVQVRADSGQGLRGEDEGGCDCRLSAAEEAVPAGLVQLGPVGAEDVLLASLADAEGDRGHGASVVDELIGGLLNYGELLVDPGERLVTEVIGLLRVRGDQLEGPGEVGEDGDGKGTVCRVAELEGSLAEGGGLESSNAVVDHGVVEDVLGMG
jgi:hypothetical protein